MRYILKRRLWQKQADCAKLETALTPKPAYMAGAVMVLAACSASCGDVACDLLHARITVLKEFLERLAEAIESWAHANLAGYGIGHRYHGLAVPLAAAATQPGPFAACAFG